MGFNVNLCFRQKTSKSEISFQTLTIECNDYLIAEDVINLWTKRLYQIFETESYKNKRSILSFKFNRKFDIELIIDGEKTLLSELRKNELVTLPLPKENGIRNENEMPILYDTIRTFIETLVKSSEIFRYDMKSEISKNEQLLLLKPSESIVLNDFQLYTLLGRLKEPRARELANNFEKNGNFFLKNEKAESREFLTILIEKFGPEFLIKLVEIPKKPFGEKTVNRLFESIKKKGGQTINLTFDGINNFEFNLVDDSLVVTQNKTNIATISDSGELKFTTDSPKLKYMSATLLLYFGINANREILYFGQETGTCSYCKKPLEDPISLYWGYGKTCAQKINLPWG
jgi:hypothetical protein